MRGPAPRFHFQAEPARFQLRRHLRHPPLGILDDPQGACCVAAAPFEETRPSDRNAHILPLARFERLIDNDHATPAGAITPILRRISGSTSDSGFHTASFGEISVTGSGHAATIASSAAA